ncbi:MAG TPA: hypothetical protein VGX23_12160 [Actinocrinis sp.]|nr:hypothetical protein [Actinocrinis sp.]
MRNRRLALTVAVLGVLTAAPAAIVTFKISNPWTVSATGAVAAGVFADAQFRLSLILADSEDWSGALRAGEQAFTVLDSAGRKSVAVPVAINNCKLAWKTEESDLALKWGGIAIRLAEQRGDAVDRAVATHHLALVEGNANRLATAIQTSRRAAGLWKDRGYWWDAAIASENAARDAEVLGDLAAATELWSMAVDYREREDSRPHLVATLINLSAVYATGESYPLVVTILKRAQRQLDEGARSAHPALAFELDVRYQAAGMFLPDHEEVVALYAGSAAAGAADPKQGRPDESTDEPIDVVTKAAAEVVQRYLAAPGMR